MGLRPGCGSEGPGEPGLGVCLWKVSPGSAKEEVPLSAPRRTRNRSMARGPSTHRALAVTQTQRAQHLPGLDWGEIDLRS